MIVLPKPPALNQLNYNDPHECCGTVAAVCIALALGKQVDVNDTEIFDTQHGDDPVDGTGGAVHVEFLNSQGLAAHDGYQNENDLRVNLEQGHYNMVAIMGDHNGDPGGSIPHWQLCYGYDGSTYYCMNPLGGVYRQYNRYAFASSLQNYGVECDVDARQQEPPAPQEEEEMAQPGIEFNGKHVVVDCLGGRLFVKEYPPTGPWQGYCPTLGEKADAPSLPSFSQKANPSLWTSPGQLHVTARAADDIHTLEYWYDGTTWHADQLP